MKALLLKDFLVLRKQFKTIALVLIAYGIWGALADNYLFLTSFLPIIFIMLALTSFSFDDTYKWTGYALALPITRCQLVLSKYLLTLLLAVAGLITSSIYGCLMFFISGDFMTGELFLSCLTSISIGLAGFFILLPITFHFGIEKARYIMFLLFMIPFLLLLAIERFGLLAHISLDKISDTVIFRYLLLGEAGLLIFTFLISLPLSLWIVNRKEY